MKKPKIEGYCPPDARLNTEPDNAPVPETRYEKDRWAIMDDGNSTKLIKGTTDHAQNRKTTKH